MKKIIELEDHFKTGEQTVQLVLPTRFGKQDISRVTKTASEALDYIKNVVPESGKTHLLLLAMGAEEAYGPNRNGDGFSEYPVASKTKTASDNSGKWLIAPGQELTKHYKSFETNPAHAFKHHANKDPSKASGVVKKAFWNPRMHRVELLATIDNEKDAEWIERVEAGEYPAISMGCRIKYDVCNQCGNKAPTRADYCDHAKYAMNQLNPDGTKNFVYNPDPDFFDISRVFRPADRIGYTLKKVADVYDVRLSADLGNSVDLAAWKSAAARKLSEMDKVIRGEPVATSTLAPDEKSLIVKFKDHAGAKLAAAPSLNNASLHGHSLRDVVAAADRAGVILKDAEFAETIVSQLLGRPANLSTNLVEKISKAASASLQLFEESPALFDFVMDECKLGQETRADTALDETMTKLSEKRAYLGEMLYRRLMPEGTGLRPDGGATTDMLNVGGRQTTRGAAMDAQDAVTNAHLKKILGGSALALGGYKMLSAFPSLNKFKAPLAAATGYLGYKALSPRPGGTVRTDEGMEIPAMTEMAPKMAAVIHMIECSKSSNYRHDISRAKIGSRVDSVAGVILDEGAVIDYLSDLVVF